MEINSFEEGGFWMQKQHIFLFRFIILIMPWRRWELLSFMAV